MSAGMLQSGAGAQIRRVYFVSGFVGGGGGSNRNRGMDGHGTEKQGFVLYITEISY